MGTTSSLQQLADTIQRLTYDLVRYSALCDRTCMQQLGITGSQGYTLLAVPDHESISMNDLSIKMKLASSTMTRMVDQLIQKGMVNRATDNLDRRIVLIHLTEHGQDVKTRLRNILQDFFSQVLGELTENQKGEVLYSLETLNQSILKTLKSCCDTDVV